MVLRILLISITVIIAFCCVRIIGLENHKSDLKRDQIELSHVKYGLFNVDEWKNIIAGIITKKIREFEVTDANREEMKGRIEEVLNRVIDEVERVMREKNSNGGIGGFFKQMFSDIFVDIDDIKSGIPRYADQVLDFLNDPQNREELKDYILKRFNEMADKTVGKVDYTEFDAILAKYSVPDKEMCLTNIAYQQERIKSEELLFSVVLTLSCIGLAVMILLAKNYGGVELGTMVAGAAVLLVTGLSLPMIDIEATIASFSFKLVGEPVEFKDQVLFFQSKSILQVVSLLLTNGGFGLIIVALLVFTFSVLIPISKLIGSIITISRNEQPRNWLHRFLVFKSSKWSMADVMVVAIFMSYIGFNGVINSQLTQITAFSSNVQVFTTNNSTLQAGFYLFASYCLTGLLLSAMIDRRLRQIAYHGLFCHICGNMKVRDYTVRCPKRKGPLTSGPSHFILLASLSVPRSRTASSPARPSYRALCAPHRTGSLPKASFRTHALVSPFRLWSSMRNAAWAGWRVLFRTDQRLQRRSPSKEPLRYRELWCAVRCPM